MFKFLKSQLCILMIGLVNFGVAIFSLSSSAKNSWVGWVNLVIGIFFITTYFVFRALGKGDDDGSGGKPKPSTDEGRKGIEVINR